MINAELPIFFFLDDVIESLAAPPIVVSVANDNGMILKYVLING